MFKVKSVVLLAMCSIVASGSALAQTKQNAGILPTPNALPAVPSFAPPEPGSKPAPNVPVAPLTELEKIVAQNAKQNKQAAPVEAPVAVKVPLGKNGQPLNTPGATGGSDYDAEVVTGLDEYNQRKKALAEKAVEMQKIREEEYRRKEYEKALKAAQEREKIRMEKAAGVKKLTSQEYFDRQTKIMQDQKEANELKETKRR